MFSVRVMMHVAIIAEYTHNRAHDPGMLNFVSQGA